MQAALYQCSDCGALLPATFEPELCPKCGTLDTMSFIRNET